MINTLEDLISESEKLSMKKVEKDCTIENIPGFYKFINDAKKFLIKNNIYNFKFLDIPDNSISELADEDMDNLLINSNLEIEYKKLNVYLDMLSIQKELVDNYLHVLNKEDYDKMDIEGDDDNFDELYLYIITSIVYGESVKKFNENKILVENRKVWIKENEKKLSDNIGSKKNTPFIEKNISTYITIIALMSGLIYAGIILLQEIN